MNRPDSACNDRLIIAMLQDELDDQQSNAIVEHIAGCRLCQRRCEELAASPAEWRLIVDVLNSPSGPTGFSPIPNQASLTHSYWTESLVKEMLGPPTQPEMLGRLSRYEIERVIGVGGMGVVFKAHDSELGRPVAIKVLAPFLAGNETAVQRFAREARAAAAVVHQHVVPIHNVEINRQPPFLVMHYVAGESLQARIDQAGPLELAEILRIGMQVASGLAAAHQQGLVHRDIKPSNILLEAAGVERALITDFGLALAADDVQMTRTGAFMGTPQYMSPEQALGETVDHKSDLFSLGSVLYTLCTGHPAFRAVSTLATMRRITDEQPTPISQLNTKIPDWLSNIILKLLSKDKHERFSSAEQLADLLAGCLAHVQQPGSVPLPREAARLTLNAQQATLGNRSTIAIAGILVLVVAMLSWAAVLLAYSGNQPVVGSTAITTDAKNDGRSVVNSVIGHGYSRQGEQILFENLPIDDLEAYQEDFARTKERTFQLAENVDAASFNALSDTYTKDRSNVYLKLVKSGRNFFVTLPDADSESFQVVSDKLAADSNDVWWYGQKIPNIDPRSLRVIHDGFVWKDAHSVWYQYFQIEDAHPSSFEHLTQQYYRDANRVYWVSSPIADADPLTFRVFGNDLPYGADRDSAWYKGRKLAGVDSSTFDPIHPHIYKDKHGVYADGRIISKARPESFRLLAKLDDQLDAALLTDGAHHFVYLSPIDGVYQIESDDDLLTLTQEIRPPGGKDQKEIDEFRVVLDSSGRISEPVLKEHKEKVDLVLSSHREHLRKAKSILNSRKRLASFERIVVPGNIVAISSDQQSVILLNQPAVDRPIFGQATLWDLENQKEHSALPEAEGWNWSFVPNRKICLAACLKDGRARMWDYSQQEWFGDWITTMSAETLGVEQIVAFSPNGKVMAAIDNAGYPQFWDLTKSVPVLIHDAPRQDIHGAEQQVAEGESRFPQTTSSLLFSSDGTFCFVKSDKQLTVWNSSTGEKVAGPFEHILDDFVYQSDTGQLATVHRQSSPSDLTTITIHSATDRWATVRTIDLPGQMESAKWLGDEHLLTTMFSEANQTKAASKSIPWAFVVPVNADQPGNLTPVREVVLTVALADGKRWIAINRHSAFCMSLGNPEPLWEKEMKTWEKQEPEEIQYQVWLNDPSWIAIEQRTSVGALTVRDLNTGIEVLRTNGYKKAFFAGSSIAEGYRVHRDNIRATGDRGLP